MSVRTALSVRGALAGAVAATVWAAQQPIDKRLFGVDYDDAWLLGRGVTKGRWTYPVGLAIHALNGAAFGAVYANVAPRVPLPSWARGPAAGLLEHGATWPLTAVLPKLHPAGDELPRLWGSDAALAQATWRHLLFGTVLGELERRLNPPGADAELPAYEVVVSPNGHGTLDDSEVVAFTPGEPDLS